MLKMYGQFLVTQFLMTRSFWVFSTPLIVMAYDLVMLSSLGDCFRQSPRLHPYRCFLKSLLVSSRKRVGLSLVGAIERKTRAHIESATSQSISASSKHKLVTCLEVLVPKN
jgi:hypothetical protein